MDKLKEEFKQAHVNYVCSQPDGTKLLSQDTFIAGCEYGFQNCKKRFLSALQKRLVQFTNDEGERILPPIPLGLFLADVVKEVEGEISL